MLRTWLQGLDRNNVSLKSCKLWCVVRVRVGLGSRGVAEAQIKQRANATPTPRTTGRFAKVSYIPDFNPYKYRESIDHEFPSNNLPNPKSRNLEPCPTIES